MKGEPAMMGLGWQELAIDLVIILIIFGAGKLPEVARSLGMGVKEFKQEAVAPVGPGESAASASDATIRSESSGAAGETVETVRTEAAPAGTTARDAV